MSTKLLAARVTVVARSPLPVAVEHADAGLQDHDDDAASAALGRSSATGPPVEVVVFAFVTRRVRALFSVPGT